MASQGTFHREFLARLETILLHGLGLSVDIHSPDFTSLRRSLQERQVLPSYLEVFRTTTMALASTRKEVAGTLLTYHGEGLWVTQPDVAGTRAFRQAVCEAAEHLKILQSAWLNHECASKFFAGYCFGTYLPPLYTRSGAEVVADNTRVVQRLLDEQCRLADGSTPLVLLEMPPLTYFVAGDLAIPSFFRLITEQSACGLVLDVGHLWTVFRYSRAARSMSLDRFVEMFLGEFPLDRVVEIHVAGLAVHESHQALIARSTGRTDAAAPAWTDAHAAPIPSILFEMLDQILDHPQLTSLKGLALEVDTKPVELIVDEFDRFSQRYAVLFQQAAITDNSSLEREKPSSFQTVPSSASTGQGVEDALGEYVSVLVGKAEPVGSEWNQDVTSIQELDLYRSVYLPYEILHWGGKVEDMFVDSCRQLTARNVLLDDFVSFWFREPRALSGSYDFFLLKVERFVEFVHEVAPELQRMAEREAEALRQAYRFANELNISPQVK
jgi:uncharacterized protein